MSFYGDLPFAAAVVLLAGVTGVGVAVSVVTGTVWLLWVIAVLVAALAALYLREYSMRPDRSEPPSAVPSPSPQEEEFDDPVIEADRIESNPTTPSDPPSEPLVPTAASAAPSTDPADVDDGVE